MADKTITTRSLNLVAAYVDGDDRQIVIENPNTAINLVNAVKDLQSFCKTSQVIIGDKNGAAFKDFKSAVLKNRTVTQLDLT